MLFVLQSLKIEFLPRHLAAEIQRVEREYQNQQVELRLVAALAKGQEYFDTSNFSQIDTKELEDVNSFLLLFISLFISLFIYLFVNLIIFYYFR